MKHNHSVLTRAPIWWKSLQQQKTIRIAAVPNPWTKQILHVDWPEVLVRWYEVSREGWITSTVHQLEEWRTQQPTIPKKTWCNLWGMQQHVDKEQFNGPLERSAMCCPLWICVQNVNKVKELRKLRKKGYKKHSHWDVVLRCFTKLKIYQFFI